MSVRAANKNRLGTGLAWCSSCMRQAKRLKNSQSHRRWASTSEARAESPEDVNEGSEREQTAAGPSSRPLSSPKPLRPTPSQSRLEASKTRSILAGLTYGHLSTLQTLQAALLPKWRKRQSTPSRLEIHAVAHYLIRSSRTGLAAGFIADAVTNGTAIDEWSRRRGLIDQRTLLRVIASSSGRKPAPSNHLYFTSKSKQGDAFDHANLKPIEPSRTLSAKMELLQALLKVRHPRGPRFYNSLITECTQERLPDLAASVYVGLVEEWITEGRVAEGASLGDFHEGGGPARDAGMIPCPSTAERNRWFRGVRTWKMPGERLSPHDRLDLWHPQKLALPEKMRNFPLPLPTSPPSLVPEPSSRLLNLVLSAVRLDPDDGKTTPVEFAASARALAILANTVHNRTLPIGALPALLVAFRALPYHPMIFPASFTHPPDKEPYAYSASSHAHGALLSLLLAPPTYPSNIRIQSRTFSSALSEMFAASKASYVFPPLSVKSCNVLLQYALNKLKRPAMLSRLLVYMKDTFGTVLPTVSLNILYRNGTLLRRNDIAGASEKALFGDEAAALESLRPEDRILQDMRRVKLAQLPADDMEPEGQRVHYEAPDSPPIPSAAAAQSSAATELARDDGAQPDEYSLVSLITHLGATSQFARLTSLVYTLIPGTRDPDALRSSPLTPHVYGALLGSLNKSGSVGLAQMVYIAAKEAESASWDDMRAAIKDGTASSSTALGWFLPIEAYTSVLQMTRRMTLRDGIADDPDPVEPASRARRAARHLGKDVAGAFTWARDVMEKTGSEVVLAPPRPDARYFNAYIDIWADAWKLQQYEDDVPLEGLSTVMWEHLREIVSDMEANGVPVPAALQERAELGYGTKQYTRIPAPKTKGWDVSRSWIRASRAATDQEVREAEEYEEDWVVGVERNQFAKRPSGSS